MRRNIILIVFICLSIIFGVAAAAHEVSGYPQPMNDYVNDYAGVIDSVDAELILKMFKKLEYQTGIEAVVVTVNSIKDYGTGETTVKAFATNLFNYWGVGHKKKNNGIMILVAVKDRKCRIVLGGGYPGQYEAKMKKVVDEAMVPYFKKGDYSRGIYEGSRAVIETVTKKVSWFSFYKWHILIGILIIVCILAGISCMRSGKKGWGWAFFAAAGVLLLLLLRMAARGKSSSGFGGGSSFGGGASGSW